jgi:hypothetical protein
MPMTSQNVDWKLLRRQKLTLVQLLSQAQNLQPIELTKTQQAHLQGLVELIDVLEDARLNE